MAENPCPDCGKWVGNPMAPEGTQVRCLSCAADRRLASLGARLIVRMEFDAIVADIDPS